MADGRARGGGWTYLMLATLAVAVFILVNRASSSTDAPAAEPTPRSSSSTTDAVHHRSRAAIATQPLVRTRLAPRPAAPARHCGSAGCCPTVVRLFGTQADITRVIASFQRRGFAYAAPPLVAPVSGDPRTSGTYLRWLGEREDDTHPWGLVNAAKGTLEGHPHWTTVFEVSRARCPTQ